MQWRLKAVIQALLGVMPRGAELHHALQRRAGGLKDFVGELRTKIDDGLLMIDHLRAARMRVDGARFLETGSGWYPTLPFLLYFGGAREVITLDLNRHLRLDLALRCAAGIQERTSELADATGGEASAILARVRATMRELERGADLNEATAGAIGYRAPADASATGLPDGSVDVVFSNDVLEHVPEPVIARLFAEAERILRPGGVVFHSVNCGDHYAYVDSSISQLNYLSYSDAEWAKYNNAFLYQNRLRAVDFTAMARASGLAIEIDTSRPHPRRLAELARIRVHPTFSRYTREQLAITSVSFVGRKPEAGPSIAG